MDDSDRWEHIVNDKKFLIEFGSSGVRSPVPIEELEKIDSNNSDFLLRNRYAIYSFQKGEIDRAEKIWKDRIIEYPNDKLAILNLLRASYLLGDFENCRIFLKEAFKKSSPTKDFMLTILNWLKKEERLEESVIFLDAVSHHNELEISALEEIGNYFLSINDLARARIYYEKILSIYAFHGGALSGLTKVNCFEAKWEDALLYGRATRKIGFDSDYPVYLLQAYYETGEYEEGLEFVKSVSAKYKQQKQFLQIWIEILLSTKPNSNLVEISSFSNALGTEEKKELLFFISSRGKNFTKKILNGN